MQTLPKNMSKKISMIVYAIICALFKLLFGTFYTPMQSIFILKKQTMKKSAVLKKTADFNLFYLFPIAFCGKLIFILAVFIINSILYPIGQVLLIYVIVFKIMRILIAFTVV